MERWITVKLKINIPENIRDKELQDWINFNVGLNSCLSNDNPLVEEDLQPVGGWVDVGG